MKNAQQATQRWIQNTTGATQTWIDNFENTSKPIVASAVKQAHVAAANFAEAINSGRWAKSLEAVGDAGIKAAARAKQSNYGTGVQAAEPKFANFMGKLIAYEEAGIAAIDRMPKGNLAAGKARANAWIDYMAAGKGRFK